MWALLIPLHTSDGAISISVGSGPVSGAQMCERFVGCGSLAVFKHISRMRKIRRVWVNNINDQHYSDQFGELCADGLPCTNHNEEILTNKLSRVDQSPKQVLNMRERSVSYRSVGGKQLQIVQMIQNYG